MFKNQLSVFLLLICSLLMSCKNDNKELHKKLNDEVMAVHDEIMPKMAEINRLKRQLNAYKATVSDDNVALKDSLINTILLLSESEDLMNDWMKNFKFPDESMKHEDVVTYLTNQKDSIKQVGDIMYKSMAIANGFVKEMPDSLKTNIKK